VKKVFITLFVFLNFAVVAALLISYISVLIPPDKYWMPSLFGMAYPFLVVANILFILFWLLFKSRFALLSLVSILIGWGFLSRYVQISGKETETEGIKVLSYNVRHFQGDGTIKPKENANKILTFLNEQNADIICLQESRLRKNNIFNLPDAVKSLNSIEHYQYARSSSTFGSVTLTRYPIVNMGEIRFEHTTNMSIYTDIKIDSDTVRVFNLHLQSYSIDPNKYSIIDSLGTDQKEDLKEVREMGSKLKKAFQLRAEQVREIRKYINESPYPIIICGDFNDTPVSYAYQKLRGDFNDAFVCSGKGIGRTYIGKLPSFRIDNIFHSDTFESFNFQTGDFRLSDHLPVSCTLVKK
jgi:endonuclease/exonuclease/phosphatase family metal-dependent hydrolase